MFSQTLDQVRARLIDEGGLFDADRDSKLLRPALADVLKKLGTYRLCGDPKSVTLTSVRRTIQLPDDFLAFAAESSMFKTTSTSHVAVPYDGCFAVNYYAIPMDSEGVPLVHDLLVEPLMLWVEYKIIKLIRDHKLSRDIGSRSVSYGEVKQRETDAMNAIVEARGKANMLTPYEVQQLIINLQRRPFRNPH